MSNNKIIASPLQQLDIAIHRIARNPQHADRANFTELMHALHNFHEQLIEDTKNSSKDNSDRVQLKRHYAEKTGQDIARLLSSLHLTAEAKSMDLALIKQFEERWKKDSPLYGLEQVGAVIVATVGFVVGAAIPVGYLSHSGVLGEISKCYADDPEIFTVHPYKTAPLLFGGVGISVANNIYSFFSSHPNAPRNAERVTSITKSIVEHDTSIATGKPG